MPDEREESAFGGKGLRPVEAPESEMETPLDPEQPGNEKSEKYGLSKLNAKDSSAFELILACLVCFLIASCVGAACLPDQRTALITGLIDTLKYVITACLGYLFATTTQSKD